MQKYVKYATFMHGDFMHLSMLPWKHCIHNMLGQSREWFEPNTLLLYARYARYAWYARYAVYAVKYVVYALYVKYVKYAWYVAICIIWWYA